MVDALSVQEAIERVVLGEGEEESFAPLRAMPVEEWSVEVVQAESIASHAVGIVEQMCQALEEGEDVSKIIWQAREHVRSFTEDLSKLSDIKEHHTGAEFNND